MTHPQQHIDRLEMVALERQLVSQLTPNTETRRLNEQRASDLQKRVGVLKERLRKLMKDRSEK